MSQCYHLTLYENSTFILWKKNQMLTEKYKGYYFIENINLHLVLANSDYFKGKKMQLDSLRNLEFVKCYFDFLKDDYEYLKPVLDK